MNNFEKLNEWYALKRRREFLDTHDTEDAWTKIQSRIGHRRRMRTIRLWGSVAAMMLLLCGTCVWWTSYHDDADVATSETYAMLAQRTSKHEAHISSTDDRCIVSVPKGAEFSRDLTDGTKIVLNAGARLSYPVAFTNDRREVELTGEAFFEVAHDEKVPFVVNTQSGTIEVLGTKFNVDAAADHTTVTLQEGSIRLVFEGREFMMLPGEQASMSKNDGIQIRQVNVGNYTSWSTGVYEFNDVSLSEITRQLSLWYDVEIDIHDAALAESRYTGVMMRSGTLESALNMLSMISDITINYKESKIEICKK